ncbi:MAG TPA: 50S ribosomal protein L28 [Planctomycetia bacterium]|jgi:large subunit ribosomal protein L28|nr:50S ribosomal protein L28 [Planctomycetia bacterium]
MGMHCDLCEKTVAFGRQLTYRGKAKYLGGVGRKITGINPRKFKPNLQSVRHVINGKIVRITVCTQCIRSGKVVKPQVNKPFSVKV